MFPFRRRKNPAEIHLAFQRAAEDWLCLPRGAQPDTVVLQAGQGRVTVKSADDTQYDVENAASSVNGPPPPELGRESLSGVEPHLVPLLTPTAFEAEPYRVLAHLVGQMHTEAGLRILAISSPSSGDGKTSTAINLAGILAQEPKIRVLLLEAELRRPSIAKYLGIRHTTGRPGGNGSRTNSRLREGCAASASHSTSTCCWQDTPRLPRMICSSYRILGHSSRKRGSITIM